MFSQDQNHKGIYCLHASVPVPLWLTWDLSLSFGIIDVDWVYGFGKDEGILVETWLALRQTFGLNHQVESLDKDLWKFCWWCLASSTVCSQLDRKSWPIYWCLHYVFLMNSVVNWGVMRNFLLHKVDIAVQLGFIKKVAPLLQWQHNTDIPAPTRGSIKPINVLQTKAYQEQSQDLWLDQFFRGRSRIRYWGKTYTQSLTKHKNKSQATLTWTTNIILLLLNYLHTLWKRHTKDNFIIPISVHYLFRNPLSGCIEMELDWKKCWLATYSKAKPYTHWNLLIG